MFYPGGNMSLNIKDREAHKLAQQLAEETEDCASGEAETGRPYQTIKSKSRGIESNREAIPESFEGAGRGPQHLSLRR
jgi:hypothetical protein